MKISKNEPILKAPSAILFLIGLMVIIHITFTKILPPELGVSLFLKMAFVPADFSQGHKLWTLVSYAFLHASWEHLLMNMVWLLAFGSAVAKRMGNAKIYLLFFLICCVIAIQVQFFFSQESSIPIIGASGGVAAMLGAAARFAFSGDILASSNRRTRLLPLRKVFTNGTTLVFVLLWVVLNVLFGLISVSPGGASVSVAWQAHLGGFFAGLLLVGWFENPPLSSSGGPGNVDFGEWSGARTDKNK